MSGYDSLIRRNLDQVRGRIVAAAARSGRSTDEVRLIAVTKYANREQMEALWQAGCRDLAESRPQQLWERVQWFPTAVWHLVGTLQRNKIGRTMPHVQWLHSVDTERLLSALQHWCQVESRTCRVLLQVNVSNEDTKHGWAADEIVRVCERLNDYPGVQVQGLMGMASAAELPKQVRQEFAVLRRLSIDLRRQGLLPKSAHELSMGMSEDFEIAIEEGATMIRIGSALFEA